MAFVVTTADFDVSSGQSFVAVVTSSIAMGSVNGGSGKFGICQSVDSGSPSLVGQAITVTAGAGTQPLQTMSAVVTLSNAGTNHMGLCAQATSGALDLVDFNATSALVMQQ